MIARNNCARSILLFSAIASSILNPFITDQSHHAIASLATSNSIAINNRLFDKFKVNGIGLGTSKNSIIRAFGKPMKIQNHNDMGCGSRNSKLSILYYRGADFHLLDGILAMAHFTNPKYTTESGVRVGDKISSIKSKYAKYGKVSKFYAGGLEIRPLIFRSQNGLIKEIMLAEGDDLC
jgi:hypothetical protein